jgi:cell division protein FtsI (penicillin-binding protein 3)
MRRGKQTLEAPEVMPRRVIQETTAATMRRMMEGVVLNGTGKLAQLDGYTSAGKTGTAQKFDPNTGRYSTHDLIASFVGFAPINTPAVTIYVQLDSPAGMHEGGQVAAPTFKRIAQQVLAYLDVPHDITLPSGTTRASHQHVPDQNLADVTDFDPVRTESTPAVEDVASPDPTPQVGTPGPTVELAEEDSVAVPQLAGKTVREVTEQMMKLGLTPVLAGTGVAVSQAPEPGAMIRRGGKITV